MRKSFLIGAIVTTLIISLTGCGVSGESNDKSPAAEMTTQAPEQNTQALVSTEKAAETTTEMAPEATTEVKTIAMYTLEDLNLLKKGDNDSEVLTVIPVSTKVEAIETGSDWTRVKYKNKEGYLHTEYLTEKADEAEDAKVQKAEEEEAARIAAEEEAAREREAAKRDDDDDDDDDGGSRKKKKSSSNKKKVVKKEKFEDCDGSGHGYYEITYSDGSTKIQEY